MLPQVDDSLGKGFGKGFPLILRRQLAKVSVFHTYKPTGKSLVLTTGTSLLIFYATFAIMVGMSPEWTFGKRLKDIRVEKGYTQRGLALKVGMDFTYLSKIESDKMVPRKEVIEDLARMLGADLNELLGLAGEFSKELKTTIEKSDAAREFICRHAATLSEDDWKKLLEDVEKKQK